MHKLLAIVTFQFAILVTLFAQSPFGTVGNKWTFEGWSEGSGWQPNWGGNCQGNSITYTTSDSIIINGITCGIITSDKGNDSLIVYQENGEVFFYENSMFYKLYDFNAYPGDTIISFRPSIADYHSLKDFFGILMEEFSTTDTVYTIVTSLDTTIINGKELRRWATKPLYTDQFNPGPVRLYETIIENIGSLNGIVGDHDLFIGDGCYGGFVCYESDGFNFGSYYFPLCNFTSSVNNVVTPQITIYPNPASERVIIESHHFNVQTIEILNWSGTLLMSTNSLDIDLQNFSSGLYFVRIIDDKNNIVVRKMVKQ